MHVTKVVVIEQPDEKIAEEISTRAAAFLECGSVSVLNLNSVPEPGEINPDILVLSPGSSRLSFSEQVRIRCKILLMPDGTGADFAEAKSVVSYGMSPRDTVTLSSIGENGCVLAIQRELVTAGGDILDRQEIPVWGVMPVERLLAVYGTLLLLGMKDSFSKNAVKI